MLLYPPDPVLDQWMALFHAVVRANHVEADGGRHLPEWCRQAAFSDLTVTVGCYCYATEVERAWWGDLWADRATRSTFATQAVARGLATPSDLERIARAWRSWATEPDGLFVIPNVEVLCRR